MNIRSRTLVLFLGLLAIALVVLSGGIPAIGQNGGDAAVALAQSLANSESTIANCRYGASPLSADQTPVLSTVNAGWYLNFASRPPNPEPANGADFVSMIHVTQDRGANGGYLPTYTINPPLNASFANYIKNNDFENYIAGNEVDRIGRGDTFPAVYAQAYHEIYRFIKSNNPTAQVGIAGLVEVTPGRLQYLDKVWNKYNEIYGTYMPVDFYTMHIYVLPELMADGVTPNGIANIALGTDKSLGKRESGGNASLCSNPDVYCFAEHDNMTVFAEHVVAMRQWMKQHGQQNKPLLLTEFSILYPYITFPNGSCDFLRDENGNCFTPSRVIKFMNNTFSYLNSKKDPNLGYPLDDNRLVQQWMWFSVYTTNEGSASNLAEANLSTLTPMGQNFKNYVASETLYQNLVVEDAADVVVATEGAPTATAEISVNFRNNGNQKITDPFTVTFYKNAGLTQVIGSVTFNPDVNGCSSSRYTASISWPGLPKGVHNYYAHVDSGSVIAEVPAGDGDNIGMGTVTVYTNQVKLPLIKSAN